MSDDFIAKIFCLTIHRINFNVYAIHSVAYPALHTQLLCEAIHMWSETNTLYAPLNVNMIGVHFHAGNFAAVA